VFARTSNERNDLTHDNPTREDDLIEECLENKDLLECEEILSSTNLQYSR